jgi:hypothetical protein
VAFAEDQFAASDWLTLNGGVRLTRFSGAVVETAVSPRVGATVRVPRWDWVARGSYGRYYQAPPLTTVSGPLLDLAVNQGFGFLPLKGERDEQYEIGLAIPVRGWTIDLDEFRTRNFFDHDIIGNSNIFIPLTIDTARIRGTEATVRSRAGSTCRRTWLLPTSCRRKGAVSGAHPFEPPSDDFFFLDHTATRPTGADVQLPAGAWLSASVGTDQASWKAMVCAQTARHTQSAQQNVRQTVDRCGLGAERAIRTAR